MKKITLTPDLLPFRDQVAAQARGYYNEPLYNRGRRALEVREVLKRRLFMPAEPPLLDLPVTTMSDLFPDQMFFYGTPEAYVNNSRGYRGTPETIRGVANHDVRNGIIWYARQPFRHHHLMQIQYEYGISSWDRGSAAQGFMSSHGRFLGRFEAMELAKNNGQLRARPGVVVQKKLYSENLW